MNVKYMDLGTVIEDAAMQHTRVIARFHGPGVERQIADPEGMSSSDSCRTDDTSTWAWFNIVFDENSSIVYTYQLGRDLEAGEILV
ncbi:hypothetical protein MAR_013781 [Mya arenaria]|uniref:Uncharacterized protein n=1 Tax=Mya arenaria TaxID=6604 RepID=A0ABY7G433_MYAAR|nr:hypothetical protein MAR_013781 [Mya arenaria]